MKVTLYLVVDSEDYEPVIFRDRKEAFSFIDEILVEYGTTYGYDEDEIISVISDMRKEYNKNPRYFRGQLAGREIRCYTEEITV